MFSQTGRAGRGVRRRGQIKERLPSNTAGWDGGSDKCEALPCHACSSGAAMRPWAHNTAAACTENSIRSLHVSSRFPFRCRLAVPPDLHERAALRECACASGRKRGLFAMRLVHCTVHSQCRPETCGMTHSVARLRAERLARAIKPFKARGSRTDRCADCRVQRSHCFCTWKPSVESRAGVCLIMHDVEPLKPSNTGWLIADLVADTFAFGWSRTEVDPALLALLNDPQWEPYVVFPGEFVQPERVVGMPSKGDRRPLFILLDATWTEARKMFRKSPYLDRFPVLSIQPESLSRYRLRRSKRDDHLCTAEVAALCLELADDEVAAYALDAYLDLFSERYLQGKRGLPVNLLSAAHERVRPYLAGESASDA